MLGFVSVAPRATANTIFSIIHLPSSKTEDWPNAGMMWKCAWIGVKEGPNQQSAILAIFHPQWRKTGREFSILTEQEVLHTTVGCPQKRKKNNELPAF